MDREQAANELARRGVTLEDMKNYFLTVAEPVAAMGSGIVAEPLAGFAGLAAAPFGSDAAANAVNYYRDKLTYSPRSEAGQSGMAAVGEAMAPIGEAMDYAASGAGDYIYDKTGSPALAAAAYSAPTAALELLGLKGVNQLSKSGKLGQPLEFGDIGSGGVGNKQRGIFAGVKAKGADLKRQAAAEELANRGIGRDQIWQETGWFNDVDGSWKFEIDDSQRSYTPIREPNPKDVEVAQLRADEARMAVKKFGKDNAEAYKNPRSPLHKEQLVADLKRLTDNDKRARANLDSVKAGTSEIVMGKAFDSEFMNDYPELRGLGFEHKEMPLEIRGSFDDSGDGSIMVNKGMGLPDQESTLLHETQHAIQEREGFARGGNPDSFDKIDPLAVKQAETVKGWVEATGMPADELMKGKPPTGLGSEWLKTTKPWAERPEFLAKMKEDAYFGANPFESYQRLAGEAEARNVQTRMDYTPEQRQAAAPWTTLDVPESELIVRGNSNGPMMSVSKAQAIEELEKRGIPMDYDSRMARAKEQGFDLEVPEYRGTTSDEVIARPYTHTSNRPSVANSFSIDPEMYESMGIPSWAIELRGDNVSKNLVRRGRIASIDDVKAVMDANPAMNSIQEAMPKLKEMGFDSYASDYETITFDPSNIRSVNAAFDPADIGKSGLLKSLGGVGLGYQFLSGEDEQNQF